MTYKIRSAVPSDAQALGDLLREVGWFDAINKLPQDEATRHIENLLGQCFADNSHSVFVGVDEGDQVVGYVSVHWLPYFFLPGPEGFVSELFLRPAARGKGLGGELLEEVKSEARKRGVYRLSLLNGRHRESYGRNFYQKQGWEERDKMANFVFFLEADGT